VTDILAAIDAAVGCQHCGGPLGDSPSDDFCSELCQATYAAQIVGAEPDPQLLPLVECKTRPRWWHSHGGEHLCRFCLVAP